MNSRDMDKPSGMGKAVPVPSTCSATSARKVIHVSSTSSTSTTTPSDSAKGKPLLSTFKGKAIPVPKTLSRT